MVKADKILKRILAANMSTFDQLVKEYTKKGEASVHGLMAKCVDKNGQSSEAQPCDFNY